MVCIFWVPLKKRQQQKWHLEPFCRFVIVWMSEQVLASSWSIHVLLFSKRQCFYSPYVLSFNSKLQTQYVVLRQKLQIFERNIVWKKKWPEKLWRYAPTKGDHAGVSGLAHFTAWCSNLHLHWWQFHNFSYQPEQHINMAFDWLPCHLEKPW